MASVTPKYAPCPLLRQHVAAGRLGRKSGQGFYEYGTTPELALVLGCAAMDTRIEAILRAHGGDDADYVDRAFLLVLRRPAESEARERALTKLADGTLSRATLLHELVTAPEFERVRELDDAVALGLAARERQERLSWLQAPGGHRRACDRGSLGAVATRYWSRARGWPCERRGAVPGGLLRSGVELVCADLAAGEKLDGVETVEADVRSLPFPNDSFDQALLVSTLEHVGADNTVYGLAAEDDDRGRLQALQELRRVLRPGGSLLVTVPLGEPGDHGWFRQDDVRGWTRLFTGAGLFVEEQEPYELREEGWQPAPAFHAEGVRYAERGPGASAVLCTDLSSGRLRRLLTPGGLYRSARGGAGDQAS